MKDRDLAASGIPLNLWHCANPGVEPVDATDIYLAESNLLIRPEIPNRTKVVMWLAQNIGDQMNRYYRLPGEHKRTVPTPLLVDGTEVSFPFTIKLSGVKALVDDFKMASRDEDRNFYTEVSRPDFFFLLDLGDELEYPSTFSARVVTELFEKRDEELLPTVVSLAKLPSKVSTKDGDYVYKDFVEYLKSAVPVKMT